MAETPEIAARTWLAANGLSSAAHRKSLAHLIRQERGRAFEAGVDAKTPYRHPEFGTLTADISAHRRAAVEGRKEGEGDG